MKTIFVDKVVESEFNKQRKWAVVAFFLQMLFNGVEYTFTFLSMWLYIETLVKPQHPKLMYGIVATAYLVLPVSLSLFVGRFVDRSRNIKLVYIVIGFCVIIGNVLYAIHFSIYFLIIGRFLAGLGGILRSVAVGELGRIYDKENVGKKISLMGIGFNIGFSMGPSLNYIFANIDISYGPWTINYTNFPSLFLAFCCTILLIFDFYFISNVSKSMSRRRIKFDDNDSENAHLLLETRKDASNLGNNGFRECRNFFSQLWILLSNINVATIIASAFFNSLFFTFYEIWLSLAIIEILRWKLTEMTTAYLVNGIVCTILCSSFACFRLTTWKSFLISLVAILGLTMSQLIFLIFVHRKSSTAVNIYLIGLLGIFFSTTVIFNEIILTTTLANMVNNDIKNFADSIRYAASRSAALIGFFLAPILFSYLSIVSVVNFTVMGILLALFVWRRNGIFDPKSTI